METIKIEVSEFELSLLIGLVDERLMEYVEEAERNSADVDTMRLARSLKDLYWKLRPAKPIPVRSEG